MTKEIWKDVVGYEGLYEVSSFGNIKSVNRKILSIGLKRKYYRILTSKNMKIFTERVGYKRVVLTKNKIESKVRVHRLVAEAFIPNPLDKPHVNHIDNDKTNNHILNLEWCTPKENTLHAVKQKRHVYGTKVSTSRLTEKDVVSIKDLYSRGCISQRNLAKKFCVNQSTILRILLNKTWKHI